MWDGGYFGLKKYGKTKGNGENVGVGNKREILNKLCIKMCFLNQEENEDGIENYRNLEYLKA
jgi:hypothetical protein